MHPKQLHKRLVSIEKESQLAATAMDESFKASLCDEAALLLSIADIAQSELTTCPSALSDNQEDEPTPLLLPKFPALNAKYDPKSTALPSESLHGLVYGCNSMVGTESLRIRSVSIEDSPSTSVREIFNGLSTPRTPSPLACPPILGSPSLVTPTLKRAIRSARLSIKTRHEQQFANKLCAMKKDHQAQDAKAPVTPTTFGKSKSLQGPVPKGVAITRVYRKKFSWKSYPELEQFLIANREEYLRHSALNYTLQQKQYNNLLTERLLELATQHGYVFDSKDFGFVTVRDRIRCYYKSFVQSAKKRGILMGYAARKAGLLDEDELEKTAGEDANIIIPH